VSDMEKEHRIAEKEKNKVIGAQSNGKWRNHFKFDKGKSDNREAEEGY